MSVAGQKISKSDSSASLSVDSSAAGLGHHQIHSKLLKDLNENHAHSLALIGSKESLGKGLVGKLRRGFLKIFFGDYFSKQHDFTVSLVRYLNELTTYADIELGDKKITELSSIQNKIDRLKDDFDFELMQLGSSKQLEEKNNHLNLKNLNQQQADFKNKIEEISSQLLGLEKVVRLINSNNQIKPQASSSQASSKAEESKSSQTDYDYLIFENKFRGPESRIKERLKIYLDFYKNSSKKVLEIGSGRGELLSLFKEKGIEAYGLDFDAAMVDCAKDAGLEAELGDANQHLRSLKDSSLSGIIATQVIEHMELDYLKEFLSLANKKIENGGCVVLETINPRSIVALTQHYFRDPTHVAPIHPDTIQYLIEGEGFDNLEVREINPFPESALLKSQFERDKDKEIFYGIQEVANSFEQTVMHLDKMLFGFQDYFIKASVKK